MHWFGLLGWHAKQLLIVQGEQPFSISYPYPGGHTHSPSFEIIKGYKHNEHCVVLLRLHWIQLVIEHSLQVSVEKSQVEPSGHSHSPF